MFNPTEIFRSHDRRNSLFAIATLALGLCVALGTAFAQDAQEQSNPGSAPAKGEHMGHRQMPSVDDQLKHMTKKLSLSDEQQAKLKPILEAQRTQMGQIRGDSSLSREDRFGKMKALRETTDNQIKGVLNEDQQKKFDKMRAEQHGWGQHRRGGENAPPSGNPDSPQ